MNRRLLQVAAAVAFASSASCLTAHAQSADALLDKLVQKGILTEEEAAELRDDSDQGFETAYQVKSGMPDWVTALKINGDFRGRAEGFIADHPGWTDRTRFRYRIRLAVVANLLNDFEVGLRLASGDIDKASGIDQGIDPISTNQSLQNNASKKGVFLDQAYARWTPLHTGDFSGGLTFGKMSNPFDFSQLTFDSDYTPEGIAWNMSYFVSDQHSLDLNAGAFVLDEIGSSSQDPYLGGAQVLWNGKWSPEWASSLGVGVLSLGNKQNLPNDAVPNVQTGNTRNTAGELEYNMNPIVVDAAVTHTLESFPMYPRPFPIKLFGDLMHNPSAPSNHTGYAVGIGFGKANKKKTWELRYTYRHLEADAYYEEHADSDFGAFYANPLPNSGQSAGYRAGTNIKGHIVRVSYSPYDSLNLQVRWFGTKVINPVEDGDASHMNRVQMDAAWKF
jgi:hypothetical protein